MTDVRRLASEELIAAPPLLAPEGWDFELPELERLHRLGGAVGAFAGGALVGFLTFVDLPPVRWIGNVVVSAKHRGGGVGARMVSLALEGASSAGLYSVEPAIPLYQRLGFVGAGSAYAFRSEDAKAKTSGRALDLEAADLRGVVRLDAEATGMDRRPLLHELLRAYPRTVRVAHEAGRVVGFGFAKPSTSVTELGPIVADTPQARDAVLDALLDSAPGPYEATTMDEGMMESLMERGFHRRFRTEAMFRGAPPAWHVERLACAAGLEKG